MSRPTSRTLAAQEGFTLIELLVTMSIFMFVLGATLTAFDVFNSQQSQATTRQETQDRLRTALDRISQDLRGVAGAAQSQAAISYAGPFDLVFLTVDPSGPNSGANAMNLRRVRYCLEDTTDSSTGANPNNEMLFFQVQTWTTAATPTAPPRGSCPDPGWGNQTLYAGNITNNYTGAKRAVFSYNADDPSAITSIHADVFVNTNVGSGPPTESHLSTGVYLRNQDLAPAASFTATPQTNYRVILNGSGSSSYNGTALLYTWYDGGTQVGQGQTYVYTASSGGQHQLSLTVQDPAGLTATAPTQTVTLFQ